MLYQTGTVAQIHDSRARIEFEPRTACGGCAAGQGCGLGPLLAMFRRPRRALWINPETLNGSGLEVGDPVRIALLSGQLTRFAGLAYAMPTAGLLAGAWLFAALFPGFGELSAVIGAVTGIGLSWLCLASAGKRPPAISMR